MKTTEPTKQDGKAYLRALAYALAAVPTDDDHADLQHVTFFEDRIVGSDGMTRHDGYLLSSIGTEPIAVARVSARTLLIALEYAARVSKTKPSGTFSVHHRGPIAVIEYGATLPIEHELAIADVGGFPVDARDWVPKDAPINAEGLGHIACGSWARAMKWWKSWDKDYGTAEVRGGQDDGPMRCDIISNGRRVATAFLLPVDHPPAEIRDVLPMEAMWDKSKGQRAAGRSNLDLDLSGDGAPTPGPTIIKIGETELNVTGLGDPNEILKQGPCMHRDTIGQDCLPCTLDEVERREKEKKAAAIASVPAPRKRGKKKSAEDDEEGFPSHLSVVPNESH